MDSRSPSPPPDSPTCGVLATTQMEEATFSLTSPLESPSPSRTASPPLRNLAADTSCYPRDVALENSGGIHLNRTLNEIAPEKPLSWWHLNHEGWRVSMARRRPPKTRTTYPPHAQKFGADLPGARSSRQNYQDGQRGSKKNREHEGRTQNMVQRQTQNMGRKRTDLVDRRNRGYSTVQQRARREEVERLCS